MWIVGEKMAVPDHEAQMAMAEPAIARVVEPRAVEAVPHEVPVAEAMVAHQAMMADEAVSWSSAFSPGYNGNVESSSAGNITPTTSSASSSLLASLCSSNNFEIGSSSLGAVLLPESSTP